MASLTGKAGEHAVAAQLLIRGVRVYFPAADYGVDLIANDKCRIQVKSAHISTTPRMVKQHGDTAYVFPLPKSRRVISKGSIIRTEPKETFTESYDVLVLWGIEQNRFWVVPASLAQQRQLFVVGRSNPPRFVGNIEDLKEMQRLGYTHEQIAKQYGMHRASISLILNREGFESQEASVVSQVRNCENAWENIINFEPRSPEVQARIDAVNDVAGYEIEDHGPGF